MPVDIPDNIITIKSSRRAHLVVVGRSHAAGVLHIVAIMLAHITEHLCTAGHIHHHHRLVGIEAGNFCIGNHLVVAPQALTESDVAGRCDPYTDQGAALPHAMRQGNTGFAGSADNTTRAFCKELMRGYQ